ncbi:hypothetical protein BT96DRAFT_430088 [Gymnopus androsaceus JB14]|uniref:Uncharacterized protein n=1 Tax=Gymnopus androsaceus JB14 TaxID=1447944 RepID=A0A6A4GT54_9AGAR|nr:hypothetical protein BT96DRAFT_430088 [Gymnopus androsaceus JB14]
MDNEKNSLHSGNSIKPKAENHKSYSSAAGMPSKSISSSSNNATGARPSKIRRVSSTFTTLDPQQLDQASFIEDIISLLARVLGCFRHYIAGCIVEYFGYCMAFFALLCSFFIPPNMPVQLFIYMLLTLVIGLCSS